MTVPFRVEALAAIAREAEELARRAATAPLQTVVKDDRTPVTEVDRAVNLFLHRELTRLVPESGWLSEESVDDPARIAAPFVWIVDPIDGTEQLVRGIPEVAISIGLAVSERVVAAAVVNPMTGESGVWVEGAPPLFHGLAPQALPASLDDAVAIVSRSESGAGAFSNLAGVVGATRVVGSVAYKLLRVAAGADALTFSVRPKFEWDVCGGVGLLAGGGRVYLRLDGAPVLFNQARPRIPCGAVAGPEALAAPLRDRVNARLL